MKYLVLLFLVAHPLLGADTTSAWRQNGAPFADTDSRKSADGFGAAVVITSDADWETKWNKPAAETPKFTEIEKLKRGERAWVLIFFANPQPDDHRGIDVGCDIKITRPNGNVTEDKDLTAMKAPLK